MTCTAKAIICDEIFDENSLPSEQEVRDYAVRIGINPDTEKHLLNIALDGLMSPLPEDWKPCLDDRINRIYYYNVKTHQTQWSHPLDDHFENLVKKKRQEESISAGDEDSKTSIKEDLKSFEEAITTSEMNSSRVISESHKSRLTSALQGGQHAVKDQSPDGRKLLGPLGRPPLPPKRRASPASPKQGNLSLRLSPSPSASRIDIDSIGVPLGLLSPELKAEKQQPARSPALKLTGGGSAFLKSNQKQTPSPSEETKGPPEEPLFEIVKEAESIDFSDNNENNKSKSGDNRQLKHSASLGESGFDKLTKSKRFASLQESLLSLKNEMELSAKSPSSPSAPLALRGILREKPSPVAKLWDVDPLLLTNEEKEKLRIQEMKDERKQNVRFADIINKPINIQFSKTDSEDESITNDSSNDLDDFILENTGLDEELKEENELSEKYHRRGLKNEEEHLKKDQSIKVSKSNNTLFDKREPNKNIVSRLANLNADSERNLQEIKKKRIIEVDNNNREDDVWLAETQDILNQNQQKSKEIRKSVFDNTKLEWDLENNSIEKHTAETQLTKSQKKKEIKKTHERPSSPSNITQFLEILDRDLYTSKPIFDDNFVHDTDKAVDSQIVDGSNNEYSGLKTGRTVKKSKLMPEMDLKKVFESLRDRIITSSEHSESSDGGEEENMQTSPLAEERQQIAGSKAMRKLEMQQQKHFEEKKKALQLEFEENVQQIQKELQRQESIERQRFYMEVQQSVTKYKEELEAEKNERESLLRNQCEEYLKELEIMLNKEKDMRVKKLKEDCEIYCKEHEKKSFEQKAQFDEDMKKKIENSSSQLEKIVAELKQKEEKEIMRLTDESKKKIDEVRQRIELEQLEQEKTYKQELAIVEADYERILNEKKEELEKLKSEQEVELASVRSQHEESILLMKEQHNQTVRQLQDQYHQEEEVLRRKHVEKMETLNAQLNRSSEKEDITQMNREFEKVRCEKRLLEDKYKSLKEKYLRLKNEVRLSLERKRQAKLNRQLQQQRDPASTAEDSTERSTDHGKPPPARKKLTTTLSSDETTGERENVGTPKTIKRRPKPQTQASVSSATVESNNIPPAKPKNVRNPSPQQRREGVSSAEDNHTSVSEEIQTEQDNYGENWTQSALSPLENLRKQLEKLDDLEEKFPTSVHTDTYLRYPFSRPVGASCELEFYRHRLHLERESVRRAKQALSEQRIKIENRQLQLRHRQHTESLHQQHQEERELTDMEVSLHRTRALLGEKIIRLRHLEQSIERAATFTTNQDPTATLNTDSSGFSGSDLDLSQVGQHLGDKSDGILTDSVLQSLENINSEIREIWTILGKKHVPGMGPPPMLSYESRAVGQGGVDPYSLAPHRATDIAERTRRLKEWLIRTKDQQIHMIAPVIL